MGPVTLLAKYHCTGCGLGSQWVAANVFSVDMPTADWMPSVLLPCHRCETFERVRYADDGSDELKLECTACATTVDSARAGARESLEQLLCDLWYLATLGTVYASRWNRSYAREHSRRLASRTKRTLEGAEALVDDNALLSCPACASRAIQVRCRLEQPTIG